MNSHRSLGLIGTLIGSCSVFACERAPASHAEIDMREGRPAVTATRAAPTPPLPDPATTPATTPPTIPPPTVADRAPALPAPPLPAISVPRPTSDETRQPSRDPSSRPRRATTSDATALPLPPSDDPKDYADWLGHLPRAQQRRIAKFCRANPVRYQAECGGIGPLHIPLPPHIKAAVKHSSTEDPQSRFASMEAWHQALTPAQVRYVDRQCPGGEDQPSSDLCGENTPLVIAFENQPVMFTSGGTFAFEPGAPVASDWPTAKTPWIAIDLDHDASITSGAELFGSSTVLADGTTAKNGFVALAALDANHDGRIDAGDPGFASLLLWTDRDGDHRSSPDELSALASVIVSLSLSNHVEVRCDARKNCERERATMQWRDARGELLEGSVVDVYLPRR